MPFLFSEVLNFIKTTLKIQYAPPLSRRWPPLTPPPSGEYSGHRYCFSPPPPRIGNPQSCFLPQFLTRAVLIIVKFNALFGEGNRKIRPGGESDRNIDQWPSSYCSFTSNDYNILVIDEWTMNGLKIRGHINKSTITKERNSKRWTKQKESPKGGTQNVPDNKVTFMLVHLCFNLWVT